LASSLVLYKSRYAVSALLAFIHAVMFPPSERCFVSWHPNIVAALIALPVHRATNGNVFGSYRPHGETGPKIHPFYRINRIRILTALAGRQVPVAFRG
jgi:hypothetical protein